MFVTDSQDQTNSSVLATLAALAEATAPNTSTQGTLSQAKKLLISFSGTAAFINFIAILLKGHKSIIH